MNLDINPKIIEIVNNYTPTLQKFICDISTYGIDSIKDLTIKLVGGNLTINSSNKSKQLYLCYALDEKGEVIGEKRICNEDTLETCAYYVKHDYGVSKAHLNKCDYCFNGYLVQGEYIGII